MDEAADRAVGERPDEASERGVDRVARSLWTVVKPGAGTKLGLVNEPEGWSGRSELPPGVDVFDRASEPLDAIVFFGESEGHVRRRLAALAGFLGDDGILWLVHEEKAALTMPLVRALAEEAGLVVRDRAAIEGRTTAVALAGAYREPEPRGP